MNKINLKASKNALQFFLWELHHLMLQSEMTMNSMGEKICVLIDSSAVSGISINVFSWLTPI